jgi:AraC-like DNA-binding protein
MTKVEPSDIYGAAVAIVEESYPERLTARRMAQLIGCSMVELRTAYARCRAGTTLREHLREVRLCRAAELLVRWPEVHTGEIGRTVGYRSPNHFTTEFRERFAMAPAAYRYIALHPEFGLAVAAGANGDGAESGRSLMLDPKVAAAEPGPDDRAG